MTANSSFFEMARCIHGELIYVNGGELQRLERRYNEPHRLYHDTTNIVSCLKHDKNYRFALQNNRGWLEEGHPLSFALLFHDAVYVPGAKDNEEQSAQLAEEYLRARLLERMSAHSIPPDITPFINEVKRLILLTKNHFQTLEEGDENGKAMLDINLAIFNAPEEQFDRYERGIRAEWKGICGSEGEYLRERILFLEGVKNFRPLYRTPFFRGQHPRRVDDNISRSILWLNEQLDNIG